MIGSKLDFDIKSSQYAIEKIKKIKFLASQGYLIVLKDLECIYGVLYDLFNQRFTEESSNGVGHTCFVTYEDFKDPILIKPEFRIVLLKSENDLITDTVNIERKLPSPLVNRFQKHVLLLQNITKPGNYFIYNVCVLISQKISKKVGNIFQTLKIYSDTIRNLTLGSRP